MPKSKALRYAKRLITFDSTSHRSNRMISKYLEMKLAKHGFVIEKIEYRDPKGVRKVNLIAKKGRGKGGLAYFGHSDVVPVKNWHSKKYGPTEPGIARERLYGRGACDMKGSLACMLAASQLYPPEALKSPIYFVCTADEEVGFVGAKYVVEESKYYREMVDAGTKGIVGEPTSLEIVHAHKGSYRIKAISRGRAAHSSTTFGVNANLRMIPFLAEMKAICEESEADPKYHNDLFNPPTLSWNIGINDFNQAINITSPQSICTVYLRPMPGIDVQPLLDRTQKAADENGLELSIDHWGEPMHIDPLSDYVTEALNLAHRKKPVTVSYGTDGGALGELENLIVFGPGNIEQAHTDAEWISLEQLALGTEMYAKFIRRWCCSDSAM